MHQSCAISNTVFVFGPLAILAFMVIATTLLYAIILVAILYSIGLVLLAVSKRSLFRDGEWCSFGSGQMDTRNRQRYFSAYGTIAVGILINLISLLFHA